MKLLSVLSIGLLSLSVAGAGFAAELGYVDMERVVNESKLGVAADNRLQQRFGEQTERFNEQQAAIARLQQELERDKLLMSARQVETKEQDIQQRIEKFEQEVTAFQRQLLQAQQEEFQKILPTAQRSITAVAREQKLSAVFESSQSNGILYLDPERDLTNAVIGHMDANP